MEPFLVLVKLLCAHLCSDFIFQTDAINKGKREPGAKGIGYQLLHSVIHAATMKEIFNRKFTIEVQFSEV